jgi:hypothetical protein
MIAEYRRQLRRSIFATPQEGRRQSQRRPMYEHKKPSAPNDHP